MQIIHGLKTEGDGAWGVMQQVIQPTLDFTLDPDLRVKRSSPASGLLAAISVERA